MVLAVSTGMMRAYAQESDQKVSGLGIIDRVIASGSEPVFRADGYTFRVSATTEVKFGAGLKALSEVGTGTLARFQGRRDGSGEIIADKVEFDRLKLPKHNTEPADPQVATFPPGSGINADNGSVAVTTSFPAEGQGGWCGWYPMPHDIALQYRVRRIGMRVVPEYQRDLAVDDPAKIPFRFYVVEETDIRRAIFCDRGLVLVPVVALERLKSDDLLAAVLAEGVAGVLQQQAGHGRPYTVHDAAKLAVDTAVLTTAGPAGGLGIWVDNQMDARTMEHARGRMALALMADAGYDPHQAPEAWRLLDPERLPKDLAKLKDPERSRYLLNFLQIQYDPAPAPNVAAPQAHDKETVAPPSPDAAPRP